MGEKHEVDSGESILGPWLECDTEHECINDNPAANALVKGTYREPFALPQIA